MSYVLEIDSYKGPIEKLLELVQERKLEVTLVSLDRVTADFLDYFEELQERSFKVSKFQSLKSEDENFEVSGFRGLRGEGEDLKAVLSDFLVIASKLLLIKSKVLVPDVPLSREEESEIRDLEFRLKLYQELKQTKAYISKMWQESPYMVGREFLVGREPVFLPPPGLGVGDLLGAFVRVVGDLEKSLMPVETLRVKVISLKSKIEEVLRKISVGSGTLRSLHGERGRNELVVMFLAVLHLVKGQTVDVRQEGHFGDIMIEKRRGSS